MNRPLIGCIADDFTGATDLANNLVRAGMRCVQTIGIPIESAAIEAAALVVALKSRTVTPAHAVAESLAALRWLQGQGVEQVYFKYCSTFDSTAEGSIGPVTDALLDALHGPDAGFTIVCPAFPANQRTVFMGHLFVAELLLSDSGTPYFVMKVGHVPLIPYHRPGDPAVGEYVAKRIKQMRAAGPPSERSCSSAWAPTAGTAHRPRPARCSKNLKRRRACGC